MLLHSQRCGLKFFLEEILELRSMRQQLQRNPMRAKVCHTEVESYVHFRFLIGCPDWGANPGPFILLITLPLSHSFVFIRITEMAHLR
jgi:hypothetical protein